MWCVNASERDQESSSCQYHCESTIIGGLIDADYPIGEHDAVVPTVPFIVEAFDVGVADHCLVPLLAWGDCFQLGCVGPRPPVVILVLFGLFWKPFLYAPAAT